MQRHLMAGSGREVAMRVGSFGVLLLAVSGCYRYSYVRLESGGNNAVAVDEQVTPKQIRTSLLWGLVPAPDFAPAEPQTCDGHGAGRVEMTVPIWGTLVGLVTAGIVVPAQVKIFCVTDPDVEAP